MPSASLQQLLGYIQTLLHGLTLYCYISHHAKSKVKEINISAMETQKTPNKYLTCNESVTFKPNLAK